MKNLQELLKEKETELERLSQEVDALRLVARLLAENIGDKGRSAPAGDALRDLVSVPPRVKVFP